MGGRRGTLVYLSSVLQTRISVADLDVSRRFSASKYFLSVAGIVKVLAMIVLVIAAILFLTRSDKCLNPPEWFMWVFPVGSLVPAGMCVITYVLFMLGMAEDNPDPWVKTELLLTVLEVILAITMSVMTLAGCSKPTSGELISGPLGLLGGCLLAAGGGATYMMWRHRKEEPPRISADRGRSDSVRA